MANQKNDDMFTAIKSDLESRFDQVYSNARVENL